MTDESMSYLDALKEIKRLKEALDKIRTEVMAIAINGQVDEHTLLIRTGEQVKQMTLDIIDKYRGDTDVFDK